VIKKVYNVVTEVIGVNHINRKLLKAIEWRHQRTGLMDVTSMGIIHPDGRCTYEYNYKTIPCLRTVVRLPDWIYDGAIIFTRTGSECPPYRVVIARSDMCWIVPFGQPHCDGWAVETETLLKYWGG